MWRNKMDTKYILLIFTIVVLVCVVVGLTIGLQGAKNEKPVVNNTTNNTTVTVESVSNETVIIKHQKNHLNQPIKNLNQACRKKCKKYMRQEKERHKTESRCMNIPKVRN